MDKPAVEVETTVKGQARMSADKADEMALGIDHLYANDSVVQLTKHEVRLSFFDILAGVPKPRAGVVLPLLAAVELHIKLSRAIEIIQKAGILDIDKPLE